MSRRLLLGLSGRANRLRRCYLKIKYQRYMENEKGHSGNYLPILTDRPAEIN